MATASRPTSDSTAVATAQPARGIVALIESDAARKQIEPFLPKDTDLKRVAAAALLATRQNPTLLKCKPESILLAVARVAQWGLEIGVTAHLVPFGTECTAIADYKGLIELMIGSGAVRHVEADVVREGDLFEYEGGLDPILRHKKQSSKIRRDPKEPRPGITHAYVILFLAGGRKAFQVMEIEDIDRIRLDHSKQWRNGPCPAWWAKKCVVRQIAKMIPRKPGVARVLDVVEADTAADARERDARG
jgi:phage RecT family recombinase